MVERLICNEEIAGSSPAGSTIMKKSLVIILVASAVIVTGAVLFFWNNIYNQISLKLPQIKSGINDFIALEFTDAGKQILTPPPLRASEEDANALLTMAGVIEWTNSQREQNGLLPLQENPRLNTSAAIKAEDMIQEQYFAHESPSGVKIADLAKDVGYDFILIGENLALGNFKNDQVLVRAWMDSPGHRANMLNPKYQEIGVAVARGVFEGKDTWFAVQHFGEPLSACPEPSSALKLLIQSNQNQLLTLQNELDSLKNEIGNTRPRQSDYNQKISEYNVLVSRYNSLFEKTKDLIEQYNNQVKDFNACAKP